MIKYVVILDHLVQQQLRPGLSLSNNFFSGFGANIFYDWPKSRTKIETVIASLKYENWVFIGFFLFQTTTTVRVIDIFLTVLENYRNRFLQVFNRAPTHKFYGDSYIRLVLCIIMYYVSDRCCGYSFWDSDFSFDQNTPLEVY